MSSSDSDQPFWAQGNEDGATTGSLPENVFEPVQPDDAIAMEVESLLAETRNTLQRMANREEVVINENHSNNTGQVSHGRAENAFEDLVPPNEYQPLIGVVMHEDDNGFHCCDTLAYCLALK